MNSIMREKIDRKKSAEHCSYASRTGGYVLYFKTTSHTLRILPMPNKIGISIRRKAWQNFAEPLVS
jgi:hypothetical protein